jgi:hypothetical protein
MPEAQFHSPSERRDLALERLINLAHDVLAMVKPLIKKAIDEELRKH